MKKYHRDTVFYCHSSSNLAYYVLFLQHSLNVVIITKCRHTGDLDLACFISEIHLICVKVSIELSLK